MWPSIAWKDNSLIRIDGTKNCLKFMLIETKIERDFVPMRKVAHLFNPSTKDSP